MTKRDILLQAWLSGKPSPKSGRQEVNSYEQYLKDLDNYATKSSRYPELNLDIIIEGLQRVYKTDKPPPKHFLYDLIKQIELLRSGWESDLLKKREAQKSHPSIRGYQEMAVSYILSCRKNKYDGHPVQTVANEYGVSRNTVYRWVKIYKNDALDGLSEELLEYAPVVTLP